MENNKSSFPGIWKYPSDRVTPFRTPVEWLEGKKKDDNIGPHWRVYDKLYDVTDFISRHPGGTEWLEITKGLDITEAFEAHHVLSFNNVENVLAKYYIKDIQTPRNSPYTFKQDGFYKTLKRDVEPILRKVGTGPTIKVRVMQDMLIITFGLLSIFGVMFNSYTALILSGIVLTMATNGSHNFIHLKENWRKNYMDFSLQSSHDWRINHIISHHLYPNTVLDSEMSLVEPILDFRPTREKNWIQRYGPLVYCIPFFFTLFWISYIARWRNILSGLQTFRLQELIVYVQLLIFFLLTGEIEQSLISWFVLHTSASFYFALFSFTVAHHHPTIWHDGDIARPDPDFGLCQLDAIRERSDSIYENLFFVLTRYGDHSLHHLFPAVCHSKLPYLKPTLLMTLKKFKEELLALPELELYIGTFKQLQNTKPSPFFKLTKEEQRRKN